ncbi:MAG: DinB family protein [Chitinophagales bacterium]|nr:DinB family protein [Chitinophagales bacterium]
MLERKFNIESGVGKDALADYLIAIMYDARSTTFRYIRGITQHELDWQPYPDWNTVGALLAHIIAGDYFFKLYFIEKREMTPEEETALLPGLDLGKHVSELKGKPVEFYLEELIKSHEAIKEAVKKLTVEELLERRFDVYDKVNGSDLAWTLYHNAEDEVHHRGQISILRKLYKQTGEPKQ